MRYTPTEVFKYVIHINPSFMFIMYINFILTKVYPKKIKNVMFCLSEHIRQSITLQRLKKLIKQWDGLTCACNACNMYVFVNVFHTYLCLRITHKCQCSLCILVDNKTSFYLYIILFRYSNFPRKCPVKFGGKIVTSGMQMTLTVPKVKGHLIMTTPHPGVFLCV